MSERAAAAKPWPRISATFHRAEAFRQILPLLDIGDKQIRVAEFIGNIPDGNMGAEKASRMDHRPQGRRAYDPKRQDVFGMRVHHRHHVGPRFENSAMNEALEIEVAFFFSHRLAVERELDDVVMSDQFRSQRTGEKKTVRSLRMTNADMAISVDHFLMSEDAVGDDEIVKKIVEVRHYNSPPSTIAQ